MIQWQWSRFDELTLRQLYSVVAAREAVFVVEQKCAYQDVDGRDADAWHLIAWEADAVAAYLRVLGPGARFEEPSIGRVLTTQPFRSSGLGRELVQRGLQYIEGPFPRAAIRISAQAHLERFYSSFGFTVVSAPYLEDDIPHVEMLRPPG